MQTLKQTIKTLNEKIDRFILAGQFNSPEAKRLRKIHYTLTHK
jgi:hypothetical protein